VMMLLRMMMMALLGVGVRVIEEGLRGEK